MNKYTVRAHSRREYNSDTSDRTTGVAVYISRQRGTYVLYTINTAVVLIVYQVIGVAQGGNPSLAATVTHSVLSRTSTWYMDCCVRKVCYAVSTDVLFTSTDGGITISYALIASWYHIMPGIGTIKDTTSTRRVPGSHP